MRKGKIKLDNAYLALEKSKNAPPDVFHKEYKGIPANMVAPTFAPMLFDIENREHSEYVLPGGRGSTKSSFISLQVVDLIMKNEEMHACVLRQVADTLRSTVYQQILWAIDALDLTDEFHATVSPLEITRISTGQKIYFRGADDPGKIKSIKVPFGYIDYEFDSARRRIHADLSLLKKSGGSYEIEDDIYVDVNGDKEDFFNEFSPALRQDGFIQGLEEYKRGYEFAVGLSYGDISNPQYVEKTATEVNASKIHKRNTVDKIQEQLRLCLEDYIWALAFYNRMTKSGYEFTCDFKDSILNDESSEREEDRKDLANGTLRPEEYRAKYRGETTEEAKANLPKQAEVD